MCIPICRQMVTALIPMRLPKWVSPSACSSHPWAGSHGPRTPQQAVGTVPLHLACPCAAQHCCLSQRSRHPSRSSISSIPQRGWQATCQCRNSRASSSGPPASLDAPRPPEPALTSATALAPAARCALLPSCPGMGRASGCHHQHVRRLSHTAKPSASPSGLVPAESLTPHNRAEPLLPGQSPGQMITRSW